MFKKIRQIVHFKKLGAHKIHTHTITNPDRDWGIILLIFVVVNILIIIFSINLFLQISSEDLFTAETKELQVSNTIDVRLLRETLLLFEERSENFENLKQKPPRIPSVR